MLGIEVVMSRDTRYRNREYGPNSRGYVVIPFLIVHLYFICCQLDSNVSVIQLNQNGFRLFMTILPKSPPILPTRPPPLSTCRRHHLYPIRQPSCYNFCTSLETIFLSARAAFAKLWSYRLPHRSAALFHLNSLLRRALLWRRVPLTTLHG